MNIQHSSRTDAWYTPEEVLGRARQTLGNIDLDPASSAAANLRVGAKRYITAQEDGLKTSWECRDQTIFLNPPGGKTGNKSNTVLFWARLMQYQRSFKDAIFMAFSIEALQTTQNKGFPSLGEFPLCVPAKRIRFLYPCGTPGPSPSHSNVIAYIPGKIDRTNDFSLAFLSLGAIINGG